MIKTFTELRKGRGKSNTQSSLQKHSKDIEYLSKQLNILTQRKTIINSDINNCQKSQRLLGHCKSQNLLKQWTIVPNRIIQQDEQIKQVRKKQLIVRKPQPLNKKTLIMDSRQIPKGTIIQSSSTKNLGPIISPKGYVKTKIDQNKATNLMTKRDKQKIIVRLKGIIDIVNNNEIATDNMNQIMSIIDKMTEMIKN